MAEQNNTVHVKVADDYKPDYTHVVLWDDYLGHPDAPVFIKSNSTETFHVEKTARVAKLINTGVLQKTDGKRSGEPVTDAVGEPQVAPGTSDNTPHVPTADASGPRATAADAKTTQMSDQVPEEQSGGEPSNPDDQSGDSDADNKDSEPKTAAEKRAAEKKAADKNDDKK